jgi:hypothetical protein
MLRTQRQVQCDRSDASADASRSVKAISRARPQRRGHGWRRCRRLFACCGPARWGRFEVVWKRRRHLVTGSEVLAEVGGSPSAPHFNSASPLIEEPTARQGPLSASIVAYCVALSPLALSHRSVVPHCAARSAHLCCTQPPPARHLQADLLLSARKKINRQTFRDTSKMGVDL